ncbi:aminoglycoside adenylyltransferase family protein [Streptomyces sp. NPDC048290]|uniref:aminoglycoside adenylyltransferase family protein n=1 Tax=Streptomyces sp. NPDC048290 TaxID=3155811 RepID=UPI0034320FD0
MASNPTAPTAPRVLAALLRRCLGDNVLALYLHGSAVSGGLRAHSDVDVLVVVEREPTEEERRGLVGELMTVSGGDARPVEVIVVVRAEITPWRYPPRSAFLYGEWLRDAYQRGYVPGPEVMPDLAPLITMARDGDTPLYGPSARELLPVVPHADLRRAIVAGVPELLAELDTDTRNVLLTLARIWTTLATGAIRTKDAAAEWARERVPVEHQAVLEWARRGYLGEDTGAAPDGVAGCAEALVAEIGRCAGQGA